MVNNTKYIRTRGINLSLCNRNGREGRWLGQRRFTSVPNDSDDIKNHSIGYYRRKFSELNVKSSQKMEKGI